MKNKLLKTSLLIGFGSAIGATIATSIAITSTSKSEVKEVKKDTEVKTVNATGKTKVTFEASPSMSGVTFTGSTIQGGEIGKPFCSIHHPTATFEERQQDYWIYGNGHTKAGQRVKDLDPITENMIVYPYFEGDVALKNCLTMVALEHTVVTVVNHGDNNPDLMYSTDAFSWSPVVPGKSMNVLPNKAIYFKGNNPTGFNHSEEKYTSFTLAGSVNLVGNAMTLIDNGKGEVTKIPNDYCFAKLFENASGVRVISSDFLPATELKKYCYDAMFKGCTNLNVFPTYLVAATSLTEGCYKEMFSGCTSLTTISSQLLPSATVLAPYCYQQMFEGCTGLKSLDSAVLPNVTLAEGCFTGMFRNCTGLTSINDKLLPVTTLAPYCYWGMFSGCTGLTNLSTFELKATTCANYCYYDMFYNCTGITQAPALPASNLASHCYDSMFYNCSSLQTAPTLAATAMQDGCYQSMFYCSGLTSMPALPAGDTTGSLASSCYKNMFRSCKGLTDLSSSTLPAKTLAANCYETMFYDSSLTKAPSIAATTLADYCCYKMFYKCTALTASPALPATTATSWCYREMFGYCSSLTVIGLISINNLGNSTVETPLRQMFDSCTAVKVSAGSGTTFWTCPNDSTYDSDKVDNMFQRTKGYEAAGYTPAKGSTYGYSAS